MAFEIENVSIDELRLNPAISNDLSSLLSVTLYLDLYKKIFTLTSLARLSSFVSGKIS